MSPVSLITLEAADEPPRSLAFFPLESLSRVGLAEFQRLSPRLVKYVICPTR